jgi:hypothetical protein
MPVISWEIYRILAEKFNGRLFREFLSIFSKTIGIAQKLSLSPNPNSNHAKIIIEKDIRYHQSTIQYISW